MLYARSVPKRFAVGDRVGAFILMEISQRERVANGTVLHWRVHCVHCRREDYMLRSSDLNRNTSCGCLPNPGHTGFTHSDESKARMAQATREAGKVREKHPNWKGDEAGYQAIHAYARRNFQEQSCEHCGTESTKREWAMIHGKEMSRERSDWLRLCRSCHWKYDKTADKRERLDDGTFAPSDASFMSGR